MNNLASILNDDIGEEIDLFEEEIEGVLNDFYFNSKEHMFNTCISIIERKSIVDVSNIYGIIREFCYIVFNYTINNLFWINEKKLWFPSKIYSGYIYMANTKGQLEFALKSIKIIIEDYDKMKVMDREEIEDSTYIKYIYEY